MKRDFYNIIDHTADIGIMVTTDSLNDLYKKSALALFDLIVGLGNIKPMLTYKIEAKASAPDNLMVSWLGELLYFFDTDGWLFSDFQLQLNNNIIIATGTGELFDPQKHEIQYCIKAVTYHMLTVRKEKGKWVATVIFDI